MLVLNQLQMLSTGVSGLGIQTGKLQPGFIMRENPVLLVLLSNLTILVPASYQVLGNKWREIS